MKTVLADLRFEILIRMGGGKLGHLCVNKFHLMTKALLNPRVARPAQVRFSALLTRGHLHLRVSRGGVARWGGGVAHVQLSFEEITS